MAAAALTMLLRYGCANFSNPVPPGDPLHVRAQGREERPPGPVRDCGGEVVFEIGLRQRGEIGDRRGEGGVAPLIESEDAMERAVDEQRLEHHLIPGLFGERVRRKGVVEGDGVEDVDDVRAQPVDGRLDEFATVGKERQGRVDRGLLSKVGPIDL